MNPKYGTEHMWYKEQYLKDEHRMAHNTLERVMCYWTSAREQHASTNAVLQNVKSCVSKNTEYCSEKYFENTIVLHLFG